ncbi:MAG: ThiF family adenylyltransferase, partial [Muribaculaceae bacterium]|nr:ThiF family adenylyltransferase [Muribaculaceae bacterium]
MENDEMFDRAERLLGAEAMARLRAARVILFGCGGVGSWCGEALVRSGIGHITLVDMDCVAPSNINRQLPATALTIGKPKV